MEHRESHEENPEALLEQALQVPETIEHLSDGEKETLLEVLEAQIIEQSAEWDPIVRDARRKLAQNLRVAIEERRKTRGDDMVISDEYMVQVEGERRALRATVSDTLQLADLALLQEDIPDLDRFKSRGWLILLTDEQKAFWINLKLFHAVDRQGASYHALYIADRYVTSALRGKNIGEQLSRVAEDIARANRCEWIFGKQVPEDPKDLDRLLEGKRRAGYVIDKRDDGVVLAKKKLT